MTVWVVEENMHVTHSLHDDGVRAMSPRSDDLPGRGEGKGYLCQASGQIATSS
jgi:hypothetical protein